jgi:hypothetical protein
MNSHGSNLRQAGLHDGVHVDHDITSIERLLHHVKPFASIQPVSSVFNDLVPTFTRGS